MPAEETAAPAAPVEARPLIERAQRLIERATTAGPRQHGSAISQAIDEVMDIIAALKKTVDQMEEVLELVELAERQKLEDEREIESLRRAMRQIHQRPQESRRGGGESRHGGSEPRREARKPREAAEVRNEPAHVEEEPRPENEPSPHD
jgi:methyl-accepting chemotaxis protein